MTKLLIVPIQEPMLNAAQEQFGGGNPFAALANNASHSNSIQQQQGRENNDPLPNPWNPAAGVVGSRGGSAGGANSTGGTGATTNTDSSSAR